HMALELARDEIQYSDFALKFFEHFVAIAKATNELGGTGLWSEADGYYYDLIDAPGPGGRRQVAIRSMVGLVPLFAAASLDDEKLSGIAEFGDRLEWFFANRPELASSIAIDHMHQHRLLAIPSRDRLERVLRYVLDETELLSPYGVRSLSRYHRDHPYVLHLDGMDYEVHYT